MPLTHKQRLNCAVHHHPTLTSEQIADRSQIKHARLQAYASDSQPDQIPFLKQLAVSDVTDRWDVVDDALAQYHRRTVETTVAEPGNALDQAIDVCAIAAHMLTEVRELRKGGIEPPERVKLQDLIRQVRTELDELSAALEAEAGPRRIGVTA